LTKQKQELPMADTLFFEHSKLNMTDHRPLTTHHPELLLLLDMFDIYVVYVLSLSFNNISVLMWPTLLVEEIVVPGENH
jgi:hypothetical protein